MNGPTPQLSTDWQNTRYTGKYRRNDPFPEAVYSLDDCEGVGMSDLGSTEDFSIFSVGETGVGDLVAERAPDAVTRSHSETDEVTQTSICARITEVLNGQQTCLYGDYHFQQLPAPNDQIIILN